MARNDSQFRGRHRRSRDQMAGRPTSHMANARGEPVDGCAFLPPAWTVAHWGLVDASGGVDRRYLGLDFSRARFESQRFKVCVLFTRAESARRLGGAKKKKEAERSRKRDACPF